MYKVNWSNIRSIANFLHTYRHLTMSEQAQLAGVSRQTILIWRSKCGLIKPLKKFKVGRNKCIIPRHVWDNREWLYDAYVNKRLGTPAIGRMVGLSFKPVYNKLKQYGIQARSFSESTRSRHLCCNRDWITDNYIIEGLSGADCARLAGVNVHTFRNWLVRLQIPIRDAKEFQVGDRSRNFGVSRTVGIRTQHQKIVC